MQGAGPGALPEPKEVAYLLARFACNNHTICDEELRPLGACLFTDHNVLEQKRARYRRHGIADGPCTCQVLGCTLWARC